MAHGNCNCEGCGDDLDPKDTQVYGAHVILCKGCYQDTDEESSSLFDCVDSEPFDVEARYLREAARRRPALRLPCAPLPSSFWQRNALQGAQERGPGHPPEVRAAVHEDQAPSRLPPGEAALSLAKARGRAREGPVRLRRLSPPTPLGLGEMRWRVS